MQFYFLSIMTTLLAGMTLAGGYLAERLPGLAPLTAALAPRSARLSVGIVTTVVGFLKLFVYANPAQIVLVGDLIPALAGLALGGSLVAQGLRMKAADTDDGDSDRVERTTNAKDGSAPVVKPDGPVEKLAQMALDYQTPLGLAGVAAAVLHFLFPGAVLF